MSQGIDMGIAGRKAIVCGSSDGLGKACAIALARCGVDVVINGRNAEKLAATAAEIMRITGARVRAAIADVTTPDGRAALLAMEEAPDIVVNNAGGPPPGDFRNWTEDAWMKALNANMLSAVALTTSAVKGMMERRWGRVISITSSSVKAVAPMLGLSTAARAGLTGFTATLAREVAPHGVTVNNLLPGFFETGRLQRYFADLATAQNITPEQARARRVAEVPVRRPGSPEEFGVWCAFLASAHSGYITGQNIVLDGGAFPGVM
jgi:3-oxoacyl-[acyl-carrier protein] reductase